MFKVDAETREIFIYGDIGPNWLGMIDAPAVLEALEQLGSGERVTVRINSPGGDVVEGLAIFNALKRFEGGVDTVADGLAASCGSYIFAAGENRTISANAMLMIHDPWGVSMGNAEEHRKNADIYDKFAEAMAKDYGDSCDKTLEECRAIMREEVWYNAEEALAEGLATRIGAESDAEPLVAQGRFKQAPAAIVAGERRKPGSSSSVKKILSKRAKLLDKLGLFT
jgi:ATP-dependent Clp protease protease subunit